VNVHKSFLFLFLGFSLLGGWSVEADGRPLLRDFIGLNVHTTQFDPGKYLPVARLVRDYHPVHWDLGEDTSVLPAFPASKRGVDWGALYGGWAGLGIEIDACLMFESIPRANWKNLAADAEAYGRSFAREFGPSGKRGVVKAVEIGNEPGSWSDADFTTMFRAMARGIREGDPALKIATCNLKAGPSGPYEKSADCLKDSLDLVDILCVHTYPMLELYPTWKRSHPEDPRLPDYLQLVEGLCRWRDENAPGKPVWITEFGYDSSSQAPDPSGDFAKWEDVTDEQHAQWLVRALLVFSSMPVERAYIYFFNDSDEPKFHASSGLTRNGRPKAAFHAVAQLQRLLGAFRFSRVVPDGGQGVRIHEYADAENPRKVAWVIWSPTGEGREVTWTPKSLPGAVRAAERMVVDGGPARELSGRDSFSAAIPVTESPLYLVFETPARQARGED
jgi:hypothetical protein